MKVLRPEVQACLKSVLPGKHGITDLMDDMMISSFNITDDEFDFICENAEESELNAIVLPDGASFSKRRKAIEIRNKYLELFNNQ
jgi:hypothetical protein